MMTKVFLTDEQERTVAELAEWLFGGLVSTDSTEWMIIRMSAMRLGLEQMRWEMEQSREQESI